MRVLSIFIFIVLAIGASNSSVFASDQFRFSVQTDKGLLNTPHTSFLGSNIAGRNKFDLVKANDNSDYLSKEISMLYRPNKGLGFDLGFQDFKAYNHQNYTPISLAGENLLVPGIGVSTATAGFLLPGPNNQITDAFFHTEYEGHAFNIGVHHDYPILSKLRITPRFHIGYKKATLHQNFGGNVPGFIRRFNYDTKVNVRTWSPSLGIDTRYDLTPSLQFLSGFQYSYDFNSGKGRDSLSFTGVGDQSLGLKNKGETHSYKAHLGLSYALNSRLNVGVNASYQSLGNTPVMDLRTGSKPANFSYKKSDVPQLGLRLSYSF